MDPLAIPLSKLGQGPITRSFVIEDPGAHFGELPPGLGPLQLSVEIRSDAAAGLWARGLVRADMAQECRRCLTPRTVPLEIEFGFRYRPSEDISPDEERVWPLHPKAGAVDLTQALREELWISTPDFLECDPACEGLCPRCGVVLAREPCLCPPPQPDARWAALRGPEPQ